MKELIEKYLNGESTADEERQLRQALEQVPQRDGEQEALLMMLQAQPATGDVHWLTEDETETYEHILGLRKQKTWKRWSMAAAIAGIVFATAGLHLQHDRTDSLVAYVYGERITDDKEVLSMVENTMQDLMSRSTDDEIENQLNDIFNH